MTEASQALSQAIASHNASAVRDLLKAGTSIQGDYYGGSALAQAIRANDAEIARLLFDHGAPFDKTAIHEFEYLLKYMPCNDDRSLALVSLLLERGGARLPGFAGHFAYALVNDRLFPQALDLVRHFDLRGSDGTEFVNRLVNTRTLSNTQVIRTLVAAGLPLAPTELPETLLERFARWGQLPVVELLVSLGAPINEGKMHKPLVAAVAEGQLDTARYLLAHGATKPATAEELVVALCQSCCYVPAFFEFVTAELAIPLESSLGTFFVRNSMVCGRDESFLDALVARGAPIQALRAESEFLYRLEHDKPSYSEWLRAHGVVLQPQERQRLDRVAQDERDAASRDRQAQILADRESERYEKETYRAWYLEKHCGRIVALGGSLLVTLLAFGVRQYLYPNGVPEWVGITTGAMVAIPAGVLGYFVGGELGDALLSPGAGSISFGAFGREIGAPIGATVVGAAGLVVGLVYRHAFVDSAVAYYAVPSTMVTAFALSLAF